MEIVYQYPNNPKLKDLPYGTRFKFTDKQLANCEFIYATASVFSMFHETDINKPAVFNPYNGIVTWAEDWLDKPVVVITSSSNMIYSNLKRGDVFKFVGKPEIYIMSDCDMCIRLDGRSYERPELCEDPVELVPGAFVVGYQLPSKSEAGV